MNEPRGWPAQEAGEAILGRESMCKDVERRQYSVCGLSVNVAEAEEWGLEGCELGPNGTGPWTQ